MPHLRRYRRQVLVMPAEFEGQASLGTVGYELMQCAQDEFYATTALIRYANTPAECGRILLHELGHNFGFQHAEHAGCDDAMDAHQTADLFSPADRALAGWPALAPATASR